MATEGSQPLKDTRLATADLSTYQYRFVKLTSTGGVAAITADTDRPYGVLQNKPDASGKAAELVLIGITKLVAVGTITPATDLLGNDATGKAIARNPGSPSTKWCVGNTRGTAASSASDIISAVVNCVTPTAAT